LLLDGMHPNKKGKQLIADGILKATILRKSN